MTSDTRLGGPISDDVIDGLYRSHRVALLRIALLVTGSRSVAEDIVQESFLRFRSASGEISNHPAYLRKVVLNQARQYLRRREVERRHLPLAPDPDVSGGTR